MGIHKEGTPSIVIAVIVAATLSGTAYYFLHDFPWLQYLLYALSAFVLIIILQFFRKPDRSVSGDNGQIIAPADGKVVVIEEVEETEYFKDRRLQVSIFMSPVNVHINWAPVSGIVKYVKYHPGKYLVAWHPKSSTENERTSLVLDNGEGRQVLIRQIAGALARRIVWYSKQDENKVQGQEIGFIKFGSRVDLLLPVGTKVHVDLNQVVTGNRTVIASWNSEAETWVKTSMAEPQSV